jgi:hypothetical protein
MDNAQKIATLQAALNTPGISADEKAIYQAAIDKLQAAPKKPKVTKRIKSQAATVKKAIKQTHKTKAKTAAKKTTKEAAAKQKAEFEAAKKEAEQKVQSRFATITEAEVIAIGISLNKKRPLAAQMIDNSSDNKRRLSPTPENLLRWMKAPGRYDLIGVDTFERNDPTKDYKREISKQKIFSLFGIRV